MIYSGLEGKSGADREIFALRLPGEVIYVVTNPKHVGEVYKNTKDLVFDTFIEDLMLSCGTSKEAAAKSSKQPPPYPSMREVSDLNPEIKSIINLAIEFHHIQLIPSTNSDYTAQISARFMAEIEESLKWDNLLQAWGCPLDSEYIDTSLLHWAGDVLVKVGTKAYWGDRLWDTADDLLDSFYKFDRSIWKLLFHYPRLLSRDAIFPRDRIIEIMTKYFEIPQQERTDSAWFTKAMETEWRLIGLSERDMAASTLILFFVINGNTYKLCFWVLSHILTNSDLLDSVTTEVCSGNEESSSPSLVHLTKNCPILNSVLQEVLRLYTSSASMRFIAEDTVVGGKLLRKGRKVMIPYRQLHEDPSAWVDDSLQFRPERWLKNAALKRNPSFRPFGGGATLCAGRNIAQQEVLSFVGIVLSRYNIEVLDVEGENQNFPRVDELKPTLGMMSPFLGHDCRVRISPR